MLTRFTLIAMASAASILWLRGCPDVPDSEVLEAPAADVTGAVRGDDQPDATAPEDPATDTGEAADAAVAFAGDCTAVPAELPLEQRCAMAGAEVHQFSNTCVGGCPAVEKAGMMCGQALTMGCKCPDGQCIDENSGCCRPINR
jgi:hypothetical protein